MCVRFVVQHLTPMLDHFPSTAARIESTGFTNRVHLSNETAKLLIQAGKENWIQKRENPVSAEGKGDFVTWWLVDTSSDPQSVGNSDLSFSPDGAHVDGQKFDDRCMRLIDWNVEMLSRSLKAIAARRTLMTSQDAHSFDEHAVNDKYSDAGFLEEVVEIIKLPDEKFENIGIEDIELPEQVTHQ